MAVNLKTLPEIHFANPDASEIESACLTAYEKASGITLQPGDPVRLFLETLAYLTSVQNGLIDLAGRQNLLAYAEGAALDHLGALMGVARIPAQPARCEIRFSLAEPLDFTLHIPKGTRVATEDGKTLFATEYKSEILSGDFFVDIACVCTDAGDVNLAIGQVSRLVDPLPYIVSVSNITATVEGAAIESDERLRERIRLAPESFTVAGSSGEYMARTLEVSSDIQSVSVTTPEPGIVDVRFVLDGGVLPDKAMIDLVQSALSAETVRPLTDKVIVDAPEIVNFSVSGQWYLSAENGTLLNLINQKVQEAFQEWLKWQQMKPGRDINPSRLIEAVVAAGAKRVELEAPEFARLTAIQIARESEISFEFGGVEDE